MQVFISVRDKESMQGLILAQSGDWVQVLTSMRGDKRDKRDRMSGFSFTEG